MDSTHFDFFELLDNFQLKQKKYIIYIHNEKPIVDNSVNSTNLTNPLKDVLMSSSKNISTY